MIAKVIILLLFATRLGAAMILHGKPKDGNYNAWFSVFDFIFISILLYFI